MPFACTKEVQTNRRNGTSCSCSMDLVIGIRLIVQVCYVYCFLVSFCSLGQQIVLDFAANIKFSIEIAKCT